MDCKAMGDRSFVLIGLNEVGIYCLASVKSNSSLNWSLSYVFQVNFCVFQTSCSDCSSAIQFFSSNLVYFVMRLNAQNLLAETVA